MLVGELGEDLFDLLKITEVLVTGLAGLLPMVKIGTGIAKLIEVCPKGTWLYEAIRLSGRETLSEKFHLLHWNFQRIR